MRKLALIAATCLAFAAAPAFADDDHRRDRHHDKGYSYGYHHGKHGKHYAPHPYYWLDRKLHYFFGPPHGYFKPRPYHRPYYGHHRGHYKKRPVLPRRIIARKLHHRDYEVRGKIRYRDGYYRAHAYDRHGRPVKLLINPHNGRIVKRRFTD